MKYPGCLLMSKEEKNMVVPKLRFPEFRDSGEWKELLLNEVCEVNPAINKLPESFVYIDLESVEDGKLLQKKNRSKRTSTK